ncbi:hypothetical protein ABT030_46940 [Streptomyces mirabilis]|uniref:hypothetical protein n=1 Tax=Streptomyces mirabilis TaxID=68239 RepID=UPI003316DB9E
MAEEGGAGLRAVSSNEHQQLSELLSGLCSEFVPTRLPKAPIDTHSVVFSAQPGKRCHLQRGEALVTGMLS